MKNCLLTLLMLTMCSSAQQKPSGDAKTSGKCSPAVTGSGNTLIVSCPDPTTRQTTQRLLQAIHDSQLPMAQILSKLDTLLQQLAEIRPRRLTDEQKLSLVSLLRAVPGMTAQVMCNPAQEGCDLARDFSAVFNYAGWKSGFTSDVGDPMLGMPPDYIPLALRPIEPETLLGSGDFVGVRIRVSDKVPGGEASTRALLVFYEALKKAGLMSEIPIAFGDSGNDEPKMVLFVGRKE